MSFLSVFKRATVVWGMVVFVSTVTMAIPLRVSADTVQTSDGDAYLKACADPASATCQSFKEYLDRVHPKPETRTDKACNKKDDEVGKAMSDLKSACSKGKTSPGNCISKAQACASADDDLAGNLDEVDGSVDDSGKDGICSQVYSQGCPAAASESATDIKSKNSELDRSRKDAQKTLLDAQNDIQKATQDRDKGLLDLNQKLENTMVEIQQKQQDLMNNYQAALDKVDADAAGRFQTYKAQTEKAMADQQAKNLEALTQKAQAEFNVREAIRKTQADCQNEASKKYSDAEKARIAAYQNAYSTGNKNSFNSLVTSVKKRNAYWKQFYDECYERADTQNQISKAQDQLATQESLTAKARTLVAQQQQKMLTDFKAFMDAQPATTNQTKQKIYTQTTQQVTNLQQMTTQASTRYQQNATQLATAATSDINNAQQRYLLAQQDSTKTDAEYALNARRYACLKGNHVPSSSAGSAQIDGLAGVEGLAQTVNDYCSALVATCTSQAADLAHFNDCQSNSAFRKTYKIKRSSKTK